MFLSEQAWHLSHFAPDHLFFFNKFGCSVRDITQSSDVFSRMAVVADNSVYEHGVTAFNELTLFGKSTIEANFMCAGNIRVYILKKDEK